MTKLKKRSKLMRRLTDCGDGQHEPVSDTDSYGNSVFKCKKCGNRIYGANGYEEAGLVSSYATSFVAGTTSPGYQSGFSINKPKRNINFMSSGTACYSGSQYARAS